MEIIAKQKNTRQSPRKVRLVANTVRKMPLKQALEQLQVMERRASLVVTKVIRQALANAWHNHNLSADEVSLKNILVETGPTYKRWQAVSRGRAHNIFKRTSHIKVILESKADIKMEQKQAKAPVKKAAAKKKEADQDKQAAKQDRKDEKAKEGMAAPQKTKAPQEAMPRQKTTQQKVVKKAS
jgi:large subunit ribosomal protein L22